MAKETSDMSFQADVLEAKLPVLVDFWAVWCGPCRVLGPVIEKVAEKAAGKALVYKLNVDDNPEAASRYGVTAIPTVILFQNGKAVQQLVGVQPEQAYLKALNI